MRKFWLALLLTGLFPGCSKDNPQRLFEMFYPNIRFDIPAGLPGGPIPQVLVIDDLPTGYDFYLSQNGVSDGEVAAINAASATLTALDNFDFDFIFAISVRVCAAGSPSCNMVDEVFYLEYEDILAQRGSSELRLLPSLINAKRTLSNDRFKLELWFNFDFATPASISTRLDMTFDALR